MAVINHKDVPAPAAVIVDTTHLASTNEITTHTSILDVLARHVEERPDHQLFRWVDPQCNVSDSLSYQKLWTKACAIAHLLQVKKVAHSERVMIVYPFGLDFLAGLIGCMMAGVVPCSVYPPNPKKFKTTLPAFNLKVLDAGATFALTTSASRRLMVAGEMLGHKTKVTWLATDSIRSPPSDWRPSAIDTCKPDDIAFIQYTSGSTGSPKGVMISQQSLLYNAHLCSVTCNAMSISDPDERSKFTVVSWMPQYHDMGLLGFFFMGIYSGVKGVVCSPVDFILNPILWHDMMVKYEGRATLGPNFAYGLLVKRLQHAQKNQPLHKKWTHVDRVVCAAEPVDPNVMEKVMTVLGVKQSSLYIGYGLAEVGLAVCFSPYSVLDGFVACGVLWQEDSKKQKIRIVDEQGQEVPDGTIGEVFVHSPNQVALGYWGDPALSQRTFHRRIEHREGDWLATGDLGRVVDKQIYIAGRKKELIIINGKNVYPHDIERLLEAEFPEIVRPGSTVAFQNSSTDVGVALEIRKTVKHLDGVSSVFSESLIRRLVSDAFEVNVGNIQMLKQGCIPKTTSGKLKRAKSRQLSVEDGWPAGKLLKRVRNSTYSTDDSLDTSSQDEVEATIKAVVGEDIDMDADWDANGLTSLMHAELIGRVQEVHRMTLTVNFQQTCPTPRLLKALIEASSSKLFPVSLGDLGSTRKWTDSHTSLPLPVLGLLQGIGIFLLLIIFVVCLIPPYFIGKYAAQLSTTFEIGDSERYATISWLPVAIPSFFVTFSLVVILLKWIIIGRYDTCVVDLPSTTYLRWWFVDRLMELWERWVGGFIVDTKLIWIFYRLLGANLAWSCNVKSFVREFDLVEVGSNTSIEHQIRCRKFSPWKDGVPSLTFRKLTVGSDCSIKGMVGPGVNVGASSKVDVFASLAEGCQVAEGTWVKGTPAYNGGCYDGAKRERGYCLVETLKVVWLPFEMYLLFGLLLLSQICLNQQLPNTWRYAPLMYWIMMLVVTSLFGILASIALKWTLIGRRRPGDEEPSPWQRIARWCCDYHYSIVAMTLVPFLGMSRSWNMILFLHGLDVDLVSKPGASLATFKPSKVDLVRIRRSFMSNLLIDSDDAIEIVDSNLGFNVHIGSGVKICRSVIPPRSVITESVYDGNFQVEEQKPRHSWVSQILMEVFPLVCALLVCASFIPAYELFVAAVLNTAPIVAIWSLCAVALVQSLTWIFVERLLQTLVFLSSDPAHLFVLYSSYLIIAWQSHDWNMLVTSLHGTCFFRYYLWLMGSRVEGELWYFGSHIYDFSKLTFEDKTLIDDAHVMSHHVVFGSVVVRETHVGGIVHPGTYCPAGAQLTDRESGPWKVYLGSSSSKDEKRDAIGGV